MLFAEMNLAPLFLKRAHPLSENFSKEKKNEQRIFLFLPPPLFEHELQQKIIPVMFFFENLQDLSKFGSSAF